MEGAPLGEVELCKSKNHERLKSVRRFYDSEIFVKGSALPIPMN